MLLVCSCLVFAACSGISEDEAWPPPVKNIDEAPVVSPEASLDSLVVPPGFDVELVASEPMIHDPVAIDFDEQGRLWVVEMRGFMRKVIESAEDYEPIGQVTVLEDTNGDGRMDNKTVFMDSLVLGRSVNVLDEGVLVAEPPHLWFAKDTDGDLQADEKIEVRGDYGSREGNPEGLANSPTWGMDNWIHNTHYDGRFRYTNDSWTYDSTLALGQWGLSMSNYGRFYRNSNADPLRFAMLDPHYYVRNPNLEEAEGADVLIGADAEEVWPIRTTIGVNRGYREGVLRKDSTLRTFTAASALAVYRGDRYPEDFQGDVFVPEPAANLIRRFEVITHEDGTREAVNAYDRAEFLASTDERFRPVNMASGPDGSLYVVDMYRGVLEHRNYLSQYLKNHIEKRGLAEPVGLGRIYRVVNESNPPREEKPQLENASAEELVETLRDPNGWWRDQAQQLLVQRHHTEVATQLHEMARSAGGELARLHALWTLEGLGELTPETVRDALDDQSPQVRAAAVRVSEPWLQEGNQELLAAVTKLTGDSSPDVRLQLTATLGEVPAPKADDALLTLMTDHADQPYLAEAAISGIGGREVAFLEKLIQSDGWQEPSEGYGDALQRLATTVVNSGDHEQIDAMLAMITDEADRPQWQRMAVLEGLDEEVPNARPELHRYLRLEGELAHLSRLTESSDPKISQKAADLADNIVWPGLPGYEAEAQYVLSAAEKERFQQGRKVYEGTCSTCHLSSGQGQQGVANTLIGSQFVIGQEKDLVRVVLDGKEGETGIMPPMREKLSDEEIAAVATYIRNAWDNSASAISPGLVEEVRAATAGRGEPWTDEELIIMQH